MEIDLGLDIGISDIWLYWLDDTRHHSTDASSLYAHVQ